jgi:hypothetical protein
VGWTRSGQPEVARSAGTLPAVEGSAGTVDLRRGGGFAVYNILYIIGAIVVIVVVLRVLGIL